jgi:hypothetical protein
MFTAVESFMVQACGSFQILFYYLFFQLEDVYKSSNSIEVGRPVL